jgi:uncharacterized membrane protein YuzA (DUF378 family)
MVTYKQFIILFACILLVFMFSGCAEQDDESLNLDNWVGIYRFDEFAPGVVGSNQMMAHRIYIFPGIDGIYFAHISMDGWMT